MVINHSLESFSITPPCPPPPLSLSVPLSPSLTPPASGEPPITLSVGALLANKRALEDARQELFGITDFIPVGEQIFVELAKLSITFLSSLVIWSLHWILVSIFPFSHSFTLYGFILTQFTCNIK